MVTTGIITYYYYCGIIISYYILVLLVYLWFLRAFSVCFSVCVLLYPDVSKKKIHCDQL